jgi:hypothetical protein
MQKYRFVIFPAALALLIAHLALPALGQQLPQVSLREAPALLMPGAREFDVTWGVDGNSPAERDAAGRLILFNSLQYPWRSVGTDIFQMAPSDRVTIINREAIEGGLWLEGLYRDADGVMFGWFHNEIGAGCPNSFLSVPRIRQMISRDDGRTWEDLGVVLEARADSSQCDTVNLYFAGGYGDFSVIFDPVSRYFYFYFTAYNREIEEQGVAVARLRYEDRLNPVGAVWTWNGAGWDKPGIGGDFLPIFPVVSNWHQVGADAYWGPAIHFNTYLRQYVMLLNRAVNEDWGTEGIYISFNSDLNNPAGWSVPQRLPLEMDSPLQAYPQVIGLESDGTDRVAGQVARFFLSGQSYWEIVFGPLLPIPARESGDPKDRDRYPKRDP